MLHGVLETFSGVSRHLKAFQRVSEVLKSGSEAFHWGFQRFFKSIQRLFMGFRSPANLRGLQ